jgi:sporulation protein YqfC
MSKKGFSQKMADFLDAPIVSVSESGYMELFSNTQAVVEGVKYIIDCCDSTIKLKLSENIITFKGEKLYIKSLNSSVMIICGTIITIEFSTL